MDRVRPLALLAVIALGACGGDSSGTLDGRWQSADYECHGQAPEVETVEIARDGLEIVATKVVGDPCVPSGAVTFRGELPDGESKGEVDCMVGEPEAPSNGSFEGTIEVMSADTLIACRMKFVRVD